MKIKWLAIIAVLVAVAGWGYARAAGDPEAGKAKSVTCAACHGEDGNSVNPEWPKLAGQNQKYLVRQLTAFKSGERENASMNPVAAALSSQDIEDIAAYYAAQGIQTGQASPDLVAGGQKLYRGGNADTGVPACMACHGPRGTGNPAAGYPALGGQHAKYTQLQLQAYKSTTRTTDENAVMRTIAARLSAEEIESVSSFISGLH